MEVNNLTNNKRCSRYPWGQLEFCNKLLVPIVTHFLFLSPGLLVEYFVLWNGCIASFMLSEYHAHLESRFPVLLTSPWYKIYENCCVYTSRAPCLDSSVPSSHGKIHTWNQSENIDGLMDNWVQWHFHRKKVKCPGVWIKMQCSQVICKKICVES